MLASAGETTAGPDGRQREVCQVRRIGGARVQEGALTMRGRSAKTGRFVKRSTVRRHPDTTVNEQPKKRGSGGGKKR